MFLTFWRSPQNLEKIGGLCKYGWSEEMNIEWLAELRVRLTTGVRPEAIGISHCRVAESLSSSYLNALQPPL
jgi:hypothetical protein